MFRLAAIFLSPFQNASSRLTICLAMTVPHPELPRLCPTRLMRKLIIASFTVAALAVASIPTSADARKQSFSRQPPPGPGLGLPAWGWRGLGWDGYYVYSPT